MSRKRSEGRLSGETTSRQVSDSFYEVVRETCRSMDDSEMRACVRGAQAFKEIALRREDIEGRFKSERKITNVFRIVRKGCASMTGERTKSVYKACVKGANGMAVEMERIVLP